MGTKENVNAGGINGLGEGLINTNSQEFKHLQNMIQLASKNERQERRMENQLLSIRFQMESYLNEKIEEIIPAGEFLERFIQAIQVKKKDFAKYINYDATNLAAVLKGRRKVNSDMAIKLGKILAYSLRFGCILKVKTNWKKKSKKTNRITVNTILRI